MTRIVHLSDLHCPAADPALQGALVRAAQGLRPAMVAVTGDLTRAGRRAEYAAAASFLDALNAPVLAVPGNHDVPVRNVVARLARPFRRFERALTPLNRLQVGAVWAVGLNTARGVRFSTWDWSLGAVSRGRLSRAAEALEQAAPGLCRVVLCHHPLLPDDADPARSRTGGGAQALDRLAEAGAEIVLHGHLHAPRVRQAQTPARRVLLAGAPAAFGDRDRGHGAGFNLVEIGASDVRIAHYGLTDGAYVPRRALTFPRSPAQPSP